MQRLIIHKDFSTDQTTSHKISLRVECQAENLSQKISKIISNKLK